MGQWERCSLSKFRRQLRVLWGLEGRYMRGYGPLTGGDDCVSPGSAQSTRPGTGAAGRSALQACLLSSSSSSPTVPTPAVVAHGVVPPRPQGKCSALGLHLFALFSSCRPLIARGQQPCCTSRRTSFLYVRYLLSLPDTRTDYHNHKPVVPFGVIG